MLASPFTVWSNLDALAGLLRLEVAEVLPIVAKQPRLLSNSPAALKLRFEELGDLTG